MLCALIMAGGKGTRFWPLSTEEKPKQFLKLLGNDTMLQMTYKRIRKIVPEDRIFISTGDRYKDLVLDQLPNISQENIILEPEARNTSACICLSSLYIKRKFHDVNIVVLPSDHLITDEENFIDTLKVADDFIHKNKSAIVTFGIKPTRPEVGYGYINADFKNTQKINIVNQFVEKPDENKAIEYLNEGNYYWNSGIFLWNVDNILALTNKFLNNTYNALKPLLDIKDTELEDFIKKNYCLTDSISIDYGVMEKHDEIFVIEGNFGWDDVGSWYSVDRYGKKDDNGNVLNADGVVMKSNNNIVVSNKKILLNNVNDLIIVETEECILVSSKEHAKDINLARNHM